MARTDIVSKWNGTVSFALISTPRRLRLTNRKDGGDANRWSPIDYIEVDARGVKGATIYYAFNGVTASSSLASGFNDGVQANFRLPPDSIDRLFIRATSVSAIATGNATTIWLTSARY